MSSHAFSQIYLHVTFHTKDSRAMIRGEVESRLHDYLRTRALESAGVERGLWLVAQTRVLYGSAASRGVFECHTAVYAELLPQTGKRRRSALQAQSAEGKKQAR